MATTYSNFLTQVRNYTEVDSNVLTDAIIQDFIRSVELDVAGKVDYDDLRKYSTSSFTASNRYLSLPADCMIIRSIQVIDSSNDRTFCEKRDTSFIDFLAIFLPLSDIKTPSPTEAFFIILKSSPDILPSLFLSNFF